MPKYVFKCTSCDKDRQAYTSVSVREIECQECHSVMKRQLPVIGGQEVRETIDSYTGVAWKQDQEEILKDRRDNHYWEHEVPRLVQTHSVETSIENGWLVYNDKDELVLNKPPSKR